MSESRLETVRRAFELLNSGGVESAVELLADDFVAEIPPALSAEPDVYEGHAGARRYFAAFDGLIDDVRYEPIELVEEGDAVIAWLRLTGRGSVSGIEVEQHAAVVTRVENGEITRMEPFPDMDLARKAI